MFGAEQFRRTDCSGLTKLAYGQKGVDINLYHYAQTQATYGRAVSYDQIKPGDLVFYGTASNVYHVAVYVGDGRIIHASCPEVGIIYSNLAYNRSSIYCIRRLIET